MKKIFLSLIALFIFTLNVKAGDYYIVGVDCFKKGLYDKATPSLEHAIRTNPKNVNARYYLAQSYLMQKRIPEAADQYNRILILAPTSDAAKLSQKGLSLIQQSYLATTPIASLSSSDLDKYGDNYVNYVLGPDGSLMKWASFPIKVYIQPKKQKLIAQSAFQEWQNKTNNLVSFKFVNSVKDAQITIDFMDKLETSSTKESYIAGYSKPYYQGKNIVGSEIHILAVDPATGQDIANNFIFFSTLHEIGHSLGLKGHSPDNNDVMAAQATDPKSSLSQRDINTITVFYKIDQKTLTAKSKGQGDVQLQQALDYVKTTPDKSVGWANLGDIYRGKKMYSNAVANYKKAISIEPDKAELYNLLGSTYSAMNDQQNAFTNLKKACDLDKSNIYYLYQFGQSCIATGQKAVGKSYINSYLQKNPQDASDEKIQTLLKQL